MRYFERMDPARKRRIRLVVALGTAVVLAAALVYTSFSASSEARSPSQLAQSAAAGRSYQLTGKVVDGSIRKQGGTFVGERDSLVTKCPSKFSDKQQQGQQT